MPLFASLGGRLSSAQFDGPLEYWAPLYIATSLLLAVFAIARHPRIPPSFFVAALSGYLGWVSASLLLAASQSWKPFGLYFDPFFSSIVLSFVWGLMAFRLRHNLLCAREYYAIAGGAAIVFAALVFLAPPRIY